MGLKTKICGKCGKLGLIGKSKSKCKSCRRKGSRPELGLRHKLKHITTPKMRTTGYKGRDDLLNALGFESYEHYRQSRTWKHIRTSAFATFGSRCLLCDERADVIHHIDYTKETLLGISLDALAPLCNSCHTLVEMDGENKRTLHQAQKEYARLLTNRQIVTI